MRLVTFDSGGAQKLGAWIRGDEAIVDLAAASVAQGGAPHAAFASMQALIQAGEGALDRARALAADPPEESVLATSACRLLAPLPQPAQIRDCLSFPDHLRGVQRVVGERQIAASPDPAAKRRELEASGFFEVPKSFYDFPVYYVSNRLSVVGPGEDVIWPPFSRYIDFELEWAAVIGRRGARIDRESASDFVFGYSIFNDWSARDEQIKVMGGALNVGPSAGKDFANGLGPCIATADEIPDPYDLAMVARVNGREVARGRTAAMHWRFEDLIAYISRGHDLHPGEVIASGTVGGGCAFEAGLTLAPGDVVELEVERIGVLRNRVLAPHMARAPAND